MHTRLYYIIPNGCEKQQQLSTSPSNHVIALGSSLYRVPWFRQHFSTYDLSSKGFCINLLGLYSNLSHAWHTMLPYFMPILSRLRVWFKRTNRQLVPSNLPWSLPACQAPTEDDRFESWRFLAASVLVSYNKGYPKSSKMVPFYSWHSKPAIFLGHPHFRKAHHSFHWHKIRIAKVKTRDRNKRKQPIHLWSTNTPSFVVISLFMSRLDLWTHV